LRAEDLFALPDELRNELRDALIMLDPARMSTAIERISLENRALGVILAHYANGYAYSTIFDAIMTEGEAKACAMPIPLECDIDYQRHSMQREADSSSAVRE
jgi:hypothetical protein